MPNLYSHISRTYCDPKGFAWNKEFLGFRDFALQDKLGLKIKLANANVSSRILPVRIHDLDPEDVQLFEKETGSVLRPIDFIFKSSGVNRPLAHHDERKDNLNHTFYRDQINKVAIAMKEIVTAVKHPTAQAEAAAPTLSQSIQPKKGLSIQKLVMPAVIVILLAIIGYGATVFLKQGNIQAAAGKVDDVDRSIAVLPFANMSTDKEQEYFSDGLSEELLNVLAKIPSLKVISRTSAFSFKGKNEDIRMIGEKLGVAYLLEGSVRKSGEKVRITAQLIKASDGSHLWSETFDRDMNDIFKVQDEIANAVVAKLKGQLLGTDHSIAKESKPEVYNLWLESKFQVSKGTNAALTKAAELAQQAYQLDSTDARVLAQLTICYTSIWGNMQDRKLGAKYYEKGRYYAERAIALAPNLPDGYTALGSVFFFIESDMAEAAKYYQKGLDVDPTNTRSMVSLAMALNALGEFSKATVLIKKSIEVDPLNSRCYLNLSSVQIATGDYPAALENSRRSVELGSDNLFTHIQYTNCLMLVGENELALQHAKKIDDSFWKEYCEILALWNMGKKDESRELLKKFETENKESGPFQIAEIYAWYKEKDKAFEWMDLAFKYNDPGLIDIKVSVFLKPYHDDPRYNAALKKLSLPI